MSWTTVYSKTAKGLLAVSGKGKRMTREQLILLKLVDGQSNEAELLTRTSGFTEHEMHQGLESLAGEGYLKAIGGVSRAPTIEDELDGPATIQVVVENTQAFFDAKAEMEMLNENQFLLKTDQEALSAKPDELDQETAKLVAEAEERARSEAAQRAKAALEAQAREETRIELAARAEARAAELARQVEEHEASVQRALEILAQEEAKEKAKAESAEAARKARAAAQDLARRQAEARLEAEREARAREQAEQQARAEAEAAAKAQMDEQIRRVAEQQAAEEAAAQLKAEADRLAAKQKAEEEAARIQAEREAGLEAERQAFERDQRALAEREEQTRLMAERGTLIEEQAAAAQRALEEAEQVRLQAEQRAAEQAQAEAEQLAKMQEEEAARDEEERQALQAWLAAERLAAAEAEARDLADKQQAEQQARAEAEQRELELAEAQLQRAREEAEAESQAQAQAEAEAARQLALRQQEEAESARIERDAEETAARAKAELDEQARREAEQIAIAAAQLQAKLEAEQAAMQQQEEQAHVEQERVAREEQTRLAAEEAAANARRAAEFEARAAAQAQADALARGRREAEQRERDEAMAWAMAERDRRVALGRAGADAEPGADELQPVFDDFATSEMVDPEGLLMSTTVMRDEQEAEEFAREEAEDLAREVAQELARRQGSTLGQEEASPTPTLSASWRLGSRRRIPWGQVAIFLLLAAVCLPPLLFQFASLDSLIPRMELIASERIGEPVSISAMRGSLWPAPHLRLEDVRIGQGRDIRISLIRATPVLNTLFEKNKSLKSLEIEGLAIDQQAFSRMQRWLGDDERQQKLQLATVTLKGATLGVPRLSLPAFDATIHLGQTGNFESASLNSIDKKLTMETTLNGSLMAIDFSARQWTPPLGPKLNFEDLHAKAVADSNGIRVNEIVAGVYGGTARGRATVSWAKSWRAEGEFSLADVDLQKLGPPFVDAMPVSGKLQASASYSLAGSTFDKLFDGTRVQANFEVRSGNLDNIDLARIIRDGDGNAGSGAQTRFTELNGSFSFSGNSYQFRQLNLVSGLLKADGNIDVSATGDLTGNVNADLGSAGNSARAALLLSGRVKTPQLGRSGAIREATPAKSVEDPG